MVYDEMNSSRRGKTRGCDSQNSFNKHREWSRPGDAVLYAGFRSSCLLLPETPKRGGAVIRISTQRKVVLSTNRTGLFDCNIQKSDYDIRKFDCAISLMFRSLTVGSQFDSDCLTVAFISLTVRSQFDYDTSLFDCDIQKSV